MWVYKWIAAVKFMEVTPENMGYREEDKCPEQEII